MASQEPIRLVGGTASPYTQKMVALMRYRRVPYAIRWGAAGSGMRCPWGRKTQADFYADVLFRGRGANPGRM